MDAQALPELAITLGSLDGSPGLQAVVLSDQTERYPHGVLGDKLEAGADRDSVAANALTVRLRHVVRAPAVFEDLIAIMAPIAEGRRPALVVVKSVPPGLLDSRARLARRGLEVLAEGPAFGQSDRWVHVIGAADVSGDGIPELIAVNTPHLAGVLVAYARKGASLIPSGKAWAIPPMRRVPAIWIRPRSPT